MTRVGMGLWPVDHRNTWESHSDYPARMGERATESIWSGPREVSSPRLNTHCGDRIAMSSPNFADKTIWTGDNLDILRGLNSTSVDLIYLDPPFNSNRNYAAPVGSVAAGAAFKDTWSLSDLVVAWMMAIRLLEMHRVLKTDGTIYLHCQPLPQTLDRCRVRIRSIQK